MLMIAFYKKLSLSIFCFLICWFCAQPLFATDLAEIRHTGLLRHLGIPYANFVKLTDNGVEGLDVELMKAFAAHLGVRYQYVETGWTDAFSDLTGRKVSLGGRDDAAVTAKTEIRGDILANGLTVLPWRKKLVNYSTPTFPTGIWLMARANSPIKPIKPSGNIETDIRQVMALLPSHSLLAMKGTCLDPDLYDLENKNLDIRLYTASQNLSEMIPAIIQGAADVTLLDIPTALIALQKWPGEIKVIGPISPMQLMGIAVDKSSAELLKAFNLFFKAYWQDGSYKKLVRKYYPAIFLYKSDFFDTNKTK